MNNGKVFSSLDGMACSYQCSDQFHFLPRYGIEFLETLENPANLVKNNLLITPGIIYMKSQIKKKKKKKKNCGITNTNISQKIKLMRGQKLFWAKKLWRGCSKLED